MDHSNQFIEKFYGDMKILRMDLDKQLPKETVFFRLLLHDRVNTGKPFFFLITNTVFFWLLLRVMWKICQALFLLIVLVLKFTGPELIKHQSINAAAPQLSTTYSTGIIILATWRI
jgi:hypothetical protein